MRTKLAPYKRGLKIATVTGNTVTVNDALVASLFRTNRVRGNDIVEILDGIVFAPGGGPLCATRLDTPDRGYVCTPIEGYPDLVRAVARRARAKAIARG